MDLNGVRQFVRQHHHAVLATRRRDGSPQLSPVLLAVDAQGDFSISTQESAVKVGNLRRDPRYDLVVLRPQFFGEWVSLRGEAEIVSLPEALPLLVQYYRDVSGEHPNWDEYRRAMVEERRVLLRLSVSDVGPRTSG